MEGSNDVAPLVRASYFIGIPLATSLGLLRAGRALLPALFRGQGDYALGLHDPGLWAKLHAYLLAAGALPALVGLLAGLVSLKLRSDDVWAWVGAVTNGAFVLVAMDLFWVLTQDGYFGFIISALPRFLDV